MRVWTGKCRMPIKEASIQQARLIDKYGHEPVPWYGLKEVHIEEPDESKMESETKLVFSNLQEMNCKLTIRTKHTKKAFRKWAMSKGCSRDEADAINKLVAAQKGRVSYETLYLSVIFGVYFGS